MLSTDPKALWEELKRGASDAADIAARKTNELTNMAKLTLSVKTGEAKLKGVFEEIGRLFYEVDRKGADCTEAIAACILKADRYEEDIARAKEELARLKGNAVCRSCGSEIDNVVLYCPFCGAKQEKKEEAPVGDEAEAEEEGVGDIEIEVGTESESEPEEKGDAEE